MKSQLSVIGTGYLGTTHAACMASLGFTVVGVDTDHEKIAALSRGDLPFYEPGLQGLLREQLDSGRLTFSTNFPDIADSDVHFVCVGTPQITNGLAADLTSVHGAVASILPYLKSGSLIVGKSTVPVGTAQNLAAELAISAPHSELAWNPEFLREGFAIEDTLRPNRLVVGVTSDRAEGILREVYASLLAIGTPWIRADLPTSELVKVAANAFLATKISFINAMAEVCEFSGADVTVLAKAIGYDPRIGHRFLQAGIGFGGGCLPKDIRAFIARSAELGAQQAVELLSEIDSINLISRGRVIDVVREILGEDLSGKKIAILGLAFKPESDDIRDSPSLDIASQLLTAGASVTVHDPKAMENAKERLPALLYAHSARECVVNADLILHLTEWAEYRAIDPTDFATLTRNPIIFDGRNALDRAVWVGAGWKFYSPGRRSV